MDSLTTFDPSETVCHVQECLSEDELLTKYCTVWFHHHQRYPPQEGNKPIGSCDAETEMLTQQQYGLQMAEAGVEI